jgi:menaquinone-dependent protoporphyrinogen oxidase
VRGRARQRGAFGPDGGGRRDVRHSAGASVAPIIETTPKEVSMNVLVAVASRHHSTYEIGSRLAAALEAAGLDADLRRPEEVVTLDGYDAVVLGSGVYAGRWLPAATGLADRLADELRRRPVWLFSSGPVGDAAAPAGDVDEVAAILARIDARGHRVFAGRLVPDELKLGEKLLVRFVRAKTGDYRDWTGIDAWAREIAAELGEPAVVALG